MIVFLKYSTNGTAALCTQEAIGSIALEITPLVVCGFWSHRGNRSISSTTAQTNLLSAPGEVFHQISSCCIIYSSHTASSQVNILIAFGSDRFGPFGRLDSIRSFVIVIGFSRSLTDR